MKNALQKKKKQLAAASKKAEKKVAALKRKEKAIAKKMASLKRKKALADKKAALKRGKRGKVLVDKPPTNDVIYLSAPNPPSTMELTSPKKATADPNKEGQSSTEVQNTLRCCVCPNNQQEKQPVKCIV